MTDIKKRPRKRTKPQYKYHPGAVSVTAYSPDGSPVADAVLDRIADFATEVAMQNNLLVSVNKA
jgi:hypothetical protein